MLGFLDPVLFAKGEANRGKELRVFDWTKAAEIIKERKPKSASAGLIEDWKYTSGSIFKNGKPDISDYTYLASTWATPTLALDTGEWIECFRMQTHTPGWDARTKWPLEALAILEK